MYKLSNNLNKLLLQWSTDIEYKFCIYLACHQDYLGWANIDPADVQELLGISRSEYHWMLTRLSRPLSAQQGDPYERRKIIETEQRRGQYHASIRLIGNTFRTTDELFRADVEAAGGYVDLNWTLILSKEFFALPKNAFRSAVKLLGFMDSKNPYRGFEIYPENLLPWFKTSSYDVMDEQIEKMEAFFWFRKSKKDKYVITLKPEFHSHDTKQVLGLGTRISNFLRSRAGKVRVAYNTIREIALLRVQYQKKAHAVRADIDKLVQEATSIALRIYQHLNAKQVHGILKNLLAQAEKATQGQQRQTESSGKILLATEEKFDSIYKDIWERCKTDQAYLLECMAGDGITDTSEERQNKYLRRLHRLITT
jgi:hypothetical protein